MLIYAFSIYKDNPERGENLEKQPYHPPCNQLNISYILNKNLNSAFWGGFTRKNTISMEK